jgi:hypothetical protein
MNPVSLTAGRYMTMINLSPKWAKELAGKPETGMGYQVVSVVLNNGKKLDQVVIVEGRITQIRGFGDIPFAEEQIAQIILTHDRWDFNAEKKEGGLKP